ncbi:NAD(P)-binding protein [Venturia nashicola]|uniref:NAD(P)-binding protein n=1 Tax=Venturia nashicola TaxID=86259 RepID=A0A4Z1PB49_9PEZI|nr:NAD(P)-binding protein [Venturia nashicola]TLD38544.1 NAD(P)-binding protein [Venturia nashicola]
MTGLLEGKAAAITGAVTGIGRAIVLGYLVQGASVAVNHLDDEVSKRHWETLKEEAKAILPPFTSVESRLINVPGDVSIPETGERLIQETVRAFGKLDIFISNAGVCVFSEFLDLEKSLFDTHISINLSGAFYTTQSAARQMKLQNHGGSIIGVSSISALVGGAGQTHYTPTKAGVLSLMQSCACALGKYGIRCNALLPGTIKTQLNEEDLADEGKRAYTEGRIPLGRTGDPGDLVGPAVFLGSELSGYVTGAQLLVDGGLFVNLQ